MLRLLLVEDERYLREQMLSQVPWKTFGIGEVRGAADSDEAFETFETLRPDILLTDIRIPTINGIEMARRMLARSPQLRVIFMSAYSDTGYLHSALVMGSVDYLFKPVQLDDLEKALFQASTLLTQLRSDQARRQLVENNADDLLGTLFKRILTADGTKENLLCQWETLPQLKEAAGYVLIFFSAAPAISLEVRENCLQYLPMMKIAYMRWIPLNNEQLAMLCCFEERPEAQQLNEMVQRLNILLQINGYLKAEVSRSDLVNKIGDLYGIAADKPANDTMELACRPRVAALCLQIEKMIQDRYREHNFSASVIAEEFHYTSAYICTIFKQKNGITIHDYINGCRIAKAKQLLLNPRNTMFSIATQVGYENDSYFSRVFKRLEGINPSDYRKGKH